MGQAAIPRSERKPAGANNDRGAKNNNNNNNNNTDTDTGASA